jgi:hypothetical protein
MLAVVIAAAALWAVATTCGAGFSLRLGPVRLSSNEPLRPLALALLAAGAYLLLFGRTSMKKDLESLARISPRVSRLAPVLLALLTLFLGLRFGTWLAGGSDSYGYVSQADLWLRGSLRVAQPWAAQFDWPSVDETFAPLGYRPGIEPHTIVPTYAPGVPILMALVRLVAGEPGPFLVAPLLAALGVWLTFRLGRKLVGPAEGFIASLLLITSPAFLMNLMFPMSDIPAMAFWMLAVLLVVSDRPASAFLAGLAASMAILVRPNLVPLAAVLGLAAAFRRRPGRSGWRYLLRDAALFAAGAAPGVVAIAGLNAYLYGSPLESGYGPLAGIFDPSRSLTNVVRWAAWLWDTQPAVAVLAPLGLLLPGALARHGTPDHDPLAVPARLLLAGIIVAVMGCYIFYLPFDAWWFLRFLFPMFPALLILAAAGLTGVARRLPAPWRIAVVVVFVVGAVSSQARTASDRGAFHQHEGTVDTLAATRVLERLVPDDAMIICMQESGTLRYYAHRLTLRYDWLPPEWLDRAVQELQTKGYRPYIFLEDWEVPLFRARFAGTRAGQLAQDPVAEFPPSRVLYDPLAAGNVASRPTPR